MWGEDLRYVIIYSPNCTCGAKHGDYVLVDTKFLDLFDTYDTETEAVSWMEALNGWEVFGTDEREWAEA